MYTAARRRRGPHLFHLRRAGFPVLIRQDLNEDGFVLREVFGPIDSYAIPTIARNVIGDPQLIVDLGANIGIAALKFLHDFPRAALTGVEADPMNVPMLQANLALNGLLDRVTIIPAAAATQNGAVHFAGGQAGRSHLVNAPQPSSTQIPAIDILPILMNADFLKMDIEGGEWPILADPRLNATALRAICMEYHDLACPEPDSSAMATRLLNEAGFRVVEDTPALDIGVIWAVRS